MSNKQALKPFIRSWEGGYCNIPGDRGGATKWGVTIATFRRAYGRNKSVADLKAMTEQQWDHIFKTYYWDVWRADSINNQAIANLLVDWLWASGSYGIRIPQRTLGVAIDGIVGPKTIAAINGYPDQQHLFALLWHEREDFFKRIARGTNAKFLRGWLNRLNGIRYRCLVTNGGKEITWGE